MKFTPQERERFEKFLSEHDISDYETYQFMLKDFNLDPNKVGELFADNGVPLNVEPLFISSLNWKVSNFGVSFKNGYAVSMVFYEEDIGETEVKYVEVAVYYQGNMIKTYDKVTTDEYADICYEYKNKKGE